MLYQGLTRCVLLKGTARRSSPWLKPDFFPGIHWECDLLLICCLEPWETHEPSNIGCKRVIVGNVVPFGLEMQTGRPRLE